jgi:quercetin dioxygenase-like cupin family protein
METLLYGTRTSLHEFRIDKGSAVPMHSHPHELMGYLASRKMIFRFKDKTILAESGDSWKIPGSEEHGVDVIDDSVVIEVFSPVRDDYL